MPFPPAGMSIAAVVDGFLLATQYDLPWNAAVLTGFDFYDAFQCMEFLRAGYKIAVPAQNPPWCLHDDGRLSNMSKYDKYRQLFLKKYGECTGERLSSNHKGDVMKILLLMQVPILTEMF